jgi:hypothetical protein
MTQAAMALVQDKCEKCSNVIEHDGFCSWHGKFFDQWLCDDCVHEMRGGGNALGIQRPALTLDQIEHNIGALELAIRNMGMVDIITGRDSAMSNRDVSLFLDFRESKQVYQLLADILRSKLDAAKDTAAANARELLKKLNR